MAPGFILVKISPPEAPPSSKKPKPETKPTGTASPKAARRGLNAPKGAGPPLHLPRPLLPAPKPANLLPRHPLGNKHRQYPA